MTPTCARDGCPTPCTVELVLDFQCELTPYLHDVVIAYACQLPHLTAVMFATRHLDTAGPGGSG